MNVTPVMMPTTDLNRLSGWQCARPLPHRLMCYTIGLKRKERLAKWLARSPFARWMGRSRLRKQVEYTTPHSPVM